ncbi:MAG: PilZ domain-containing protein [Nitrospirota bacterium]
MLRLVCPGCKRDTYSSDELNFRRCPYCGTSFSGVHGINRRNEERTLEERRCFLVYKGQRLEATTIDSSESGFSINVRGDSSLRKGDVISVCLDDLEAETKIVWISSQPDRFRLGLQRAL